jgi:hypothetical protein
MNFVILLRTVSKLTLFVCASGGFALIWLFPTWDSLGALSPSVVARAIAVGFGITLTAHGAGLYVRVLKTGLREVSRVGRSHPTGGLITSLLISGACLIAGALLFASMLPMAA